MNSPLFPGNLLGLVREFLSRRSPLSHSACREEADAASCEASHTASCSTAIAAANLSGATVEKPPLLRRSWLIALIVVAILGVCRLSGLLFVTEVDGVSMLPQYHHGDRVLVLRTPFQRGDVVIAKTSDGERVIKQVTALRGRSVELKGLSTNSQAFSVGSVDVLGRVVAKLPWVTPPDKCSTIDIEDRVHKSPSGTVLFASNGYIFHGPSIRAAQRVAQGSQPSWVDNEAFVYAKEGHWRLRNLPEDADRPLCPSDERLIVLSGKHGVVYTRDDFVWFTTSCGPPRVVARGRLVRIGFTDSAKVIVDRDEGQGVSQFLLNPATGWRKRVGSRPRHLRLSAGEIDLRSYASRFPWRVTTNLPSSMRLACIDRDLETRISAPQPHTRFFWQVDLGSLYEINRIHTDAFTTPFRTMRVSTDGSQYQQVRIPGGPMFPRQPFQQFGAVRMYDRYFLPPLRVRFVKLELAEIGPFCAELRLFGRPVQSFASYPQNIQWTSMPRSESRPHP